MELYIGLMVVTLVYVLSSAVMDVVERQIYTFPALLLSIAWFSYIAGTDEYSSKYLLAYGLFNIALWFIFNRFKLWGAGDSDMFLVASNVLLAVVGPVSGYRIMMYECLMVIGIMMFSIFVGFIESKVKKERLTRNSNVAVVPGFAFVIITLMFAGLFWRL